MPDSEKFSEARNCEENFFCLLGGPGPCSPGKFLKYRVRDWLKMHFPRLEKLDKNESACSLALKFGRFKKMVCWLGGGGRQLPPLAKALNIDHFRPFRSF